MKLEVGMYVITIDRMELGRITHFCECEKCKERGYCEPVIDNPNMFITIYDKENSFCGYKFYKSLLDLIEVGDYVNGSEVREIHSYNGMNFVDTYEVQPYGWNSDIPEENIKSIVTKEQFSSMEYRLGE